MSDSKITAFINKERALLEAATPGPWFHSDYSVHTYDRDEDFEDEISQMQICQISTGYNGTFIANVRTSHALALEMLEIAIGRLIALEKDGYACGDDKEAECKKCSVIAHIEKLLEKKP